VRDRGLWTGPDRLQYSILNHPEMNHPHTTLSTA
jgi:hypothetical protein